MNYSERIAKFQQLLGGTVDLAFLPISADLQYLTGVPRDIPNYGTVIHPGAWLEGTWLIPNRAPVLALPRMSAEFGGLDKVQGIDLRILGDFDDPATMVDDILKQADLPSEPRIAISDETSGVTISELHKLVPNARFVSATQILRSLRVIKSAEEISIMRKAGEITEAAFQDVIKQLKHGMTELDIVSEVDYQLRKHGSLGPSFTTSLYNSGPNHPLLFGQRERTWPRVLTPPVSILFDFGGVYNGFCYDFGRTVSFGQPDDELRTVHRLIMEAQAAGIQAMRAGKVTAAEVDHAARTVIEAGGYGEAFRHRLGHGIGMDVHEPPFLTATDNTVLEAGMLFTVEPSITQFDSYSARVEDVVLVTESGGEPLTRGFQDLIIVD